MIIGKNRMQVIENIKNAAESGDFYAKVETDDAVLSPAESREIAARFMGRHNKRSFRFKAFFARRAANAFTAALNRKTEIVFECEKPDFSHGVFITSNHFGPIENTAVRHLVRKCGQKKLTIVTQITNLCMKGPLGFLMNYADTVPIFEDPHYLNRDFLPLIDSSLKKGIPVLIYPEQEMWFNYKKPRPPKRGVYYFAAKLSAPIVSLFVEMKELPQKDTDEFYKVKYIIHVLGVLTPDPQKTAKENSHIMCERDMELKKSAYERAYQKPLDYAFSPDDIAGLIKK